MSTLIDLTLTLKKGMRGVDYQSSHTVEKDGWNARSLHLYSHCGTHMDSQFHFGCGHGTIDKIPIESCIGPAWVVDLTDAGEKSLMEIQHLGTIKDRFKSGDSLLLHTGWSRFVEEPEHYRNAFPRISVELAHWCVENRVRMVGVEAPSVADVNQIEEVTEIHHILLKGNVGIVEGLTGLDKINKERVLFAAFPLKIHEGDGCPCRAFVSEDPLMDFQI